MPPYLIVWSALTFAIYSGYLGLAPWLRRRPVRITLRVHAWVLAVALGPALAFLALGWLRGAVAPTILGIATIAFFAVAFAVIWIRGRGVHEFHGATAPAFRDAWRAALAQLGHTHEVREGGSGRVERVVLTGPPNRVEIHLRQESLRGFGALGVSVAVEIAEAMERYFETHDTRLDRVDSAVHLVAAIALVALVVVPLVR